MFFEHYVSSLELFVKLSLFLYDKKKMLTKTVVGFIFIENKDNASQEVNKLKLDIKKINRYLNWARNNSLN